MLPGVLHGESCQPAEFDVKTEKCGIFYHSTLQSQIMHLAFYLTKSFHVLTAQLNMKEIILHLKIHEHLSYITY